MSKTIRATDNEDQASIAEIAQCEAEIDRIVYDLFDLSPDEIALLESAVQA